MIKNNKIKDIKAREILDSRGNPTVEVELKTDDGVFIDSVPSGASKGKYEAMELRDGGKRYKGKGVLKAVNNVNKIIAPKIIGKDPTRQKEIDSLMIKLDGTENKRKLGANAILGVSMGVLRAGAAANKIPLWKYISQIAENKKAFLPTPSFNIINGGLHSGNELDFQEFMIVPQVKPYSEALKISIKIYQTLGEALKRKFGKSAVKLGDEGGFAPPIKTPEEALDLILQAAQKSNFKKKIYPVPVWNKGKKNKNKNGSGVKIILDVAASHFFIQEQYKTKFRVFSPDDLLKYYSNLISKYPIIGIEDPFSQENWKEFQRITAKFGKKITIIGDDLLATNLKRIKEAQTKKACNGLLLKINQVGTISEAIEAGNLAKSYGWKIMVSHRSGETLDDFISDLATGIGADFIKAGAPVKPERLAKYNRLLKIEEELQK